VASRKQARIAEIRAYLEPRGADTIGEAEFAELCEQFKPAKPDTIRKWVRECAIALAPMVEGVRQDSFDGLERTLVALTAEYEHSDRDRTRSIRRMVITAKEHARFAARAAKDAAKRADKLEMADWMLTWLENPPLFPQWVRLRRIQSNPTAVRSIPL
jgi:hypothetical protein